MAIGGTYGSGHAREAATSVDGTGFAGVRGHALMPVMLLRPIQHQGQVVGWMALAPLQSVTSIGDQRFQLNQLRSSLLIGLACLLATVVIAWWLSRALLRPIREVASATHRLAGGDYAIKLPVRSADEAGQLAGDFNRMAATLASNERLRRDFMADISHELRTPLAVMRAELEAMEDGIRPLDGNALRSLQGEVGALSKLVDDLFELSLAEVGGPTYRRERIDLCVLLPVVAEAFQAGFAERGLQLRVEVPAQPLWVLGDESRLGQLLHNLLEGFSRLPLIMMTARVDEIDRLLGLELGEDDYICKPFSPRELVARVKAVLRRSGEQPGSLGLELDARAFQARYRGVALELTPVEFRMLAALAVRPGQVLSRDQLMNHIYQDHRVVADRPVDSHVKSLRRKLTAITPGHDPIRSVYGVGYSLEFE